MAPPRIQLLWWPGCPSHERALADLRAAVSEVGLDAGAVEAVRIDTEEHAERERFAGSPTIRVDGDDLLPGPAAEPAGLTCRVYTLRDGRASPTPDPEDLREALAARIRARKEPVDA